MKVGFWTKVLFSDFSAKMLSWKMGKYEKTIHSVASGIPPTPPSIRRCHQRVDGRDARGGSCGLSASFAVFRHSDIEGQFEAKRHL
jgi:hypothetical protein